MKLKKFIYGILSFSLLIVSTYACKDHKDHHGRHGHHRKCPVCSECPQQQPCPTCPACNCNCPTAVSCPTCQCPNSAENLHYTANFESTGCPCPETVSFNDPVLLIDGHKVKINHQFTPDHLNSFDYFIDSCVNRLISFSKESLWQRNTLDIYKAIKSGSLKFFANDEELTIMPGKAFSHYNRCNIECTQHEITGIASCLGYFFDITLLTKDKDGMIVIKDVKAKPVGSSSTKS